MVAHVRLILFLVLVVSGLSYFKNDYLALKTPVIYEVGGEKFAQTLQINYSQLLNWRTICFELSTRTGTNPETLIEGVLAMLSDYKYPAYLTSPQETIPDDLITSRVAVSKLLEASHTWQYVHIDRIDKSDLFYLDREQQQSYARSAEQTCDGSDCTAEIDSVYSHQTEWIEQLLFPDQSFKSWLPTYLQRSASTEGADHSPAQIILYQTIGANTGGTTAMHLLHRTLHDLGYHVLICNATNRYSSACSTPDGKLCLIFVVIDIFVCLNQEVIQRRQMNDLLFFLY